MQRLKLLLVLLLVSLILGGTTAPLASAQGITDPEVDAILSQMSPEQRVGQLFLITFYGTDISPDSDIGRLITEYGVGGVVLLEENDNFSGSDPLDVQVQQMTASLQMLAYQRGETFGGDVSGPSDSVGAYIPLFIVIQHEGSAQNYTHLLSALTPLPSNMAIGATWEPANAEATGEVLGAELAALGINLLLGPLADVVEEPHPTTPGDMGTRVFGGEPFWVSQMVAAYIRGVHEGSGGRVAVVPRHFPGHDTADRLAQADGLTVGHIRYQGFQGENRLLATRPISLDSQNLPKLLALQPIADWHNAGGLIISDALGLRGVRRFYDPQETRFPSRLIAQDAFSAGNDVLFLGNFGSNPPVDQTQTIIDTISWFVQRYNEDTALQASVDASVRRILRQKLDIYGEFEIDRVLSASTAPASLGQRADVTLATAQSALTLLSPQQADLLASPQVGQNIVIFTDTRMVRQCSTCPETPLIAVDALQSRILSLYGPEASGLVSLSDISSFSFNRLVDYLEFGPTPSSDTEPTPEPDPLPVALDRADWIAFVMLDVTPDVPSSDAVKRFLSEASVSPDTQIVVMAMGAPYYLDSTEVGKLSAYYALYGYTRPFIDVAARALFQQATLNGAPPVSVSGIGYDVLGATSPDPAQMLTLSYEVETATGDDQLPPTSQPTPGSTLTPAATPTGESGFSVRLGDTLRLSTSVILDLNGNPVPDGTPVEFIFSYTGGPLQTTSATTVSGIARTTFRLDTMGELVITAQAGQALSSIPLTARISEAGTVEFITQVPPPTETPSPTPEAVTVTADSALPSPTPAVDNGGSGGPVNFGDLFLSLIGLITVCAAVFVFSLLRTGDNNHSLTVALLSALVGLVGYIYYALMLPGSPFWRELWTDNWAASLAAWVAALIGLGLTQLGLYAWNRWGPIVSGGR